MSHKLNEPFQHQNGKNQVVQSGQCLRQALVIAGQATEASRPGDGALNHPTPWQQDETLPGSVNDN